jgi:ribosomal protein S18 acetylase RimI-like enzyme
LLIREFQPEDFDQVHSLWEQSRIALGVSDTREEILRMHQMNPDLFLVGEADNRIVAVVMGGFDGRRGIVHHLAVDPDHRNKGYGRQIMTELERRFNLRGLVKINFWVQTDNLEAVDFYQKIGYYLRPDLVTMSKVLRDQ